jgi:7,8-dihydropterin-6-yl-methyl-4-(beta-D-ribofuranosyl)aminobenzene 5'-phosphate synthase
VTILYDAFGESRSLKTDWGLSAWVEYSGKKILFDTGSNADIFAANVNALGIDLKSLDLSSFHTVMEITPADCSVIASIRG